MLSRPAQRPAALLVDDEPDLLVLLAMIAEQEGFRPILCANGADALEALGRGERPALVILDLMMPEMSGFQFCRVLKARPDLSGTPVIVLSARTQPVDRFRAEDCGADAFLAKPFDFDEVVSVFQRFAAG